MNAADATDGLPTPPPPPQERTRPVPPYIADVLTLLHILLAYARHLSLTLELRASAGSFSIIADCFGTARLPVLRARLARGLLRIQALQRVLLDRARRGRDLVWLQRREPAPRKPKPPAPTPAPQADAAPAEPPPPRRRRDTDAAPDPDALPTLKQLEAEIRRHGIGGTIADICRDLGIAPRLCYGRFWTGLSEVITGYRGNLSTFVRDLRRREVSFEPEWDRNYLLGLPDRTREATLRVLGFFIGERWPRLPDPVPRRPALWGPTEAAATSPS